MSLDTSSAFKQSTKTPPPPTRPRGVVAALVDKGISVPGQVRVAGCDGNPLAWSGSVPLTTVAPPGYEIGRKGVQLLMEQIENKAPAKTKHTRVGPAAGGVLQGG